MVRSFFLAVVGLEVRGMHQAAYILAAFALGSQLLALVRDRLLASSFGATETLDLYYAAFRLPDLLFIGVASLLSIYALLPILSKIEAENPGFAISFLRRLLLLFFVGMGAASLVAFFFVPELIRLIAPGLAHNPALVMLTKILLLQPILLGASNLLANLTQLKHRFVLYSISPLLYNLGIIGGIVFLYPQFGLTGLAWGVIAGAALHLFVQVPFFTLERTGGELPWRKVVVYARETLALSVPRTAALAAGQISLLVAVALASLFPEGSIAIFTFAWNLQAVPLTIIGVSYSVAAFPTLARFFAGNNRVEFVRHVEAALKHIIFWSIPALFLIIVLRAHLVRVILGAGVFDWDATRLTAALLAICAAGLVAQGLVLLFSRAVYAVKQSWWPLIYQVVGGVVSVLMAWYLLTFPPEGFLEWLSKLLRVSDVSGTEILFVALSASVGQVVLALWSLAALSRVTPTLALSLVRPLVHGIFATLVGGAATYGALMVGSEIAPLTTSLAVFAEGLAAGIVGLAASGLALFVLKNEEFRDVLKSLSHLPGIRTILPPVAEEPAQP